MTFSEHHCWKTAADWQLSYSNLTHLLVHSPVSVLVHHSHCTPHHHYCHFSDSESAHLSEIFISKNWLCLCVHMLLMCSHLLTDKTLARCWFKKEILIFEDISNTYVMTMWSCTNEKYTKNKQWWRAWHAYKVEDCRRKMLQRRICCVINKNIVNISTQQHWNVNLTELRTWRNNKIITPWWSHYNAVMMLKNQCTKEKIVVKTKDYLAETVTFRWCDSLVSQTKQSNIYVNSWNLTHWVS